MTTGVTISQLMECPACKSVITVSVDVTTETYGAVFDGGLLVLTLPCDNCGRRAHTTVRVSKP